jgi:hypothetical protein
VVEEVVVVGEDVVVVDVVVFSEGVHSQLRAFFIP